MAPLQFGNGLLRTLFSLGEKRGVDSGNALGMLLFGFADVVPGLLDDGMPLFIGMRDDDFGLGFRIQ